jgi:hypothetical protein
VCRFIAHPPTLYAPHGEFESECRGRCGAQDTFYLGNMKGLRLRCLRFCKLVPGELRNSQMTLSTAPTSPPCDGIWRSRRAVVFNDALKRWDIQCQRPRATPLIVSKT